MPNWHSLPGLAPTPGRISGASLLASPFFPGRTRRPRNVKEGRRSLTEITQSNDDTKDTKLKFGKPKSSKGGKYCKKH
eukprot:8031750-Pyramimonas_sp.AAC.1